MDRLRDAEPDAELSLLFVEADDQYLVILRLDEGEDLRVFGSDSAFAERVAARDAAARRHRGAGPGDRRPDRRASPAREDDEETSPAADPDADPVGDAELLADLGLSAHRLLTLCALEGMLPADVTAEICQTLGCGDELEELRDA